VILTKIMSKALTGPRHDEIYSRLRSAKQQLFATALLHGLTARSKSQKYTRNDRLRPLHGKMSR